MVTKIKESKLQEIFRKAPKRVGFFLIYFLSVLIIISGIFGLFESFIEGIFILLAGITIFPLTWKFLEQKGIKLKWWLILIIFFVFVIIGGGPSS